MASFAYFLCETNTEIHLPIFPCTEFKYINPLDNLTLYIFNSTMKYMIIPALAVSSATTIKVEQQGFETHEVICNSDADCDRGLVCNYPWKTCCKGH